MQDCQSFEDWQSFGDLTGLASAENSFRRCDMKRYARFLAIALVALTSVILPSRQADAFFFGFGGGFSFGFGGGWHNGWGGPGWWGPGWWGPGWGSYYPGYWHQAYYYPQGYGYWGSPYYNPYYYQAWGYYPYYMTYPQGIFQAPVLVPGTSQAK
jgi:hypothetical protein